MENKKTIIIYWNIDNGWAEDRHELFYGSKERQIKQSAIDAGYNPIIIYTGKQGRTGYEIVEEKQ